MNAVVRTMNDDALARLEPFLVRAPWHDGGFDMAPFGRAIHSGNRIDPTRREAESFLNRLCTLDALTFGPEGMPMPRWLFYEASALPGGIFGFALRSHALADACRARLRVPEGYEGLVPVSMYIAIPARPPHTWYGHNLASLNRLLPELNLRGLAGLTKAFALRCYRCRTQLGATQWGSAALSVHARFGALELLTAWTPAHEFPATLTYRLRITDAALRAAMGEPGGRALPRRSPSIHLRADDEAGMRALQRRIEEGARFEITNAPDRSGPVPSVPIAEVG